MDMLKPRLLVVISMVLAAAASRLIPHPPNLASISAIALFGGAYFSDRRLAFLIPLAALFLSDLILGFYSHMEVVYLSFALIVRRPLASEETLGLLYCRCGASQLRSLLCSYKFWRLGL
jgi:hypothetical protein